MSTPDPGIGVTHERCGYLLACPCWTAGAASQPPSGDALREALNDEIGDVYGGEGLSQFRFDRAVRKAALATPAPLDVRPELPPPDPALMGHGIAGRPRPTARAYAQQDTPAPLDDHYPGCPGNNHCVCGFASQPTPAPPNPYQPDDPAYEVEERLRRTVDPHLAEPRACPECGHRSQDHGRGGPGEECIGKRGDGRCGCRRNGVSLAEPRAEGLRDPELREEVEGLRSLLADTNNVVLEHVTDEFVTFSQTQMGPELLLALCDSFLAASAPSSLDVEHCDELHPSVTHAEWLARPLVPKR